MGQAHGSGARVDATQDPTPGGLCSRLRIPDGDTLEFAEGVPLQVRKDMLAVLVYRLTMNSLSPCESRTHHHPIPRPLAFRSLDRKIDSSPHAGSDPFHFDTGLGGGHIGPASPWSQPNYGG